MNELLKEILRFTKTNPTIAVLWSVIVLLLSEHLWSHLKILPWLLDILKDQLAIKILLSICLLSIGFGVTFLLLYLKIKPKAQKPASASSEALPTRKGFGLTHRNNNL